MYTNRRTSGFLKGLMTILLSSAISAVIVMVFISTYIRENSVQQQRINYSSVNPFVPNDTADIGQVQNDTNIKTDSSDPLDVADIAAKVMPSVVGISTTAVTRASLFDSNKEQIWSVGSGVIVSEDGYILTNQHVIGSNPAQIIVTLSNSKTVNARLEWSDPTLDLAIIKVDLSGLTKATLADSDNIKVGETAVAIGNPLGLQFQRTVTAGIVSALNRTISVNTDGRENYMEGLIQTDASINPGNSGGPLINSRGEVIGINTIKVARAEGMGFAIPINITKPVITSFIEKGSYTTPYMGLFAFDKVVAEYLHQDMNLQKGVYVAEIDQDSPAYKAGIRVGDIITHICDVEVNTMIELREEMFKCGAGGHCTIRYIRDGKVRETSFTLQSRTNDGLITR